MAIWEDGIVSVMSDFGERTLRRVRWLDFMAEASRRLAAAKRLTSKTKANRRAKRAAQRFYSDAWRSR
jgi:hypothetical protein